jgi:hypothetical protein
MLSAIASATTRPLRRIHRGAYKTGKIKMESQYLYMKAPAGGR